MAPRRAGQMRRDAALDAMRALEFEDKIIRKKINELLKVYGRDHWAFIEMDNYKILLETILESTDVEKSEQNLVNNIRNQSHSDDNSLNNNPGQENFMDFQPDLSITNHLENQEDIQNIIGTTNHPENQEDTQHIIESEVAHLEEIPEQVLLAENGVASDIPRRKPCFSWISDGEDDELVILERSNQ